MCIPSHKVSAFDLTGRFDRCNEELEAFMRRRRRGEGGRGGLYVVEGGEGGGGEKGVFVEYKINIEGVEGKDGIQRKGLIK